MIRVIMKYTSRFFLLSFVVSTQIFAVDIGSDTAVTRFNTQQTLNNTDRVAGFAELAAGFTLASSAVTATFDSFFPVSGNVSLTHGTLILNRDLIFRDVTTITELGNITGQYHDISFSSSVTSLPNIGGNAANINVSNVNIFLNANVYMRQESMHFTGQSIIDGAGHSLTLAPTCSIIVDSGASLMFKNIVLENVNTSKLQMVDSLGTITFNDVQLVMDNNYTMSNGKFVVLSDFRISGEGFTFVYNTDQVSTISTDGRMFLDHDMTFSYAPRVASRAQLVLLASSSELWMQGATLFTTSTGLRLDTGRLIIDRDSSLYNQGTVESEAISFADTLDVQLYPAATLACLNGLVVME